jgi:hypothetical protein
MSFVKNVVLAAFAASAVACGGAGDLAENTGSGSTDVELATSEQGICEGYTSGAVCTVRCTSSSSWFYIYGVAYGQCESAGASACGRTPSGACWSH